MRYLLPILLVGGVLATPNAQQMSDLDRPSKNRVKVVDPRSGRAGCAFWTAVEQVARTTEVRVGFEGQQDCPPGGRSTLHAVENTVDLAAPTRRAVFDQLVELRPDYRWKEVDDVVVLRPAVAWDDASSLLARRVGPLTIANLHPHDGLHAVITSAQPPLLSPHENHLGPYGLMRHRISLQFTGGTLLDALNALTEPFGGLWQVGRDRNRLYIQLRSLDFQEGSATISATLQ
jgi:hypothetical protein